MGLALDVAVAQTASQIQYVYDAAGNLVQVTRSVITPQPDLSVSNLTVGVIAINANGSYSVPVSFQVNNVGTSAATATWYDRGYLSADPVLHDTDQVLGGHNTRSINLAAGAGYVVSATFTTNTTTSAGNHTLIVRADGGATTGQYGPTGANYVPESNETNNTQTIVITLPVDPRPNLSVSNASVGAIGIAQNGAYSVPVTFTVTNTGPVTASPAWYDMAYLSANATLDDADQNLSSYNYRGAALDAGASYTVTIPFTTTAVTTSGNYTLFVKADGRGTAMGSGTNTDGGFVAESNETNNVQALSITLPAKPDLVASGAVIGAITVNQNGSYNIPVTWAVTNNGGLPAASYWFDSAYLSTNATLDTGDLPLGYTTRSASLAPGANYVISANYVTATTTTPGAKTLFVKADGRYPAVNGTATDTGMVVEGIESNNVQALSITLPAKPDLVASGAVIGAITVNQNGSYSIPVTWTVSNNGGSPAASYWFDSAYLSSNATLDTGDLPLGYSTRSAPLAAGANYPLSVSYVTETTTTPGTYTLFVKADGRYPALSGTATDTGMVVEANETNNVQALSITLPAKPDLVPSLLQVGTITKNGNGSYNIPVSWAVTNSGGSPAAPNWFDVGYLSSDGVLDNADLYIGYTSRSAGLAVGANYSVNVTYVTATTTAAGTYTLFVKADGRSAYLSGSNTDTGTIAESSESNNTMAVTVVLQ